MNDIKSAIDYFYKKMETGSIQSDEQQKHYELAISALEEQLNGDWIPVSERMPEARQYEAGELIEFLVTLKGAKVPTTAVINHNNLWSEVCWAKFESYPLRTEVIAWKPLPQSYKEPYKEGNNG